MPILPWRVHAAPVHVSKSNKLNDLQRLLRFSIDILFRISQSGFRRLYEGRVAAKVSK